MIISALKMLLDAMTLQLSGTVAEIDERNPIPLVKVQTLLQLMTLVADTIAAAKRSNDTPDENAQIMHQLEAQFEAVERDTRAMASRAVRGADVKNAIAAGALAQLRAVMWAAQVEEMVA